MTTWTADELAKLGQADELDIASRRPDDNLRPFVTISGWGRHGGRYWVRTSDLLGVSEAL